MEGMRLIIEEEKRKRKSAEDIAHGMEADANEKQGEINALKLQLEEYKAKEVTWTGERATTSVKLVTRMEEMEKLRKENEQLSSGMGSLKVERDDSLARCAETQSSKDKLEKENKDMKADLKVLRPKADERDYFFNELQAKKRSVVLLEDKLEQKVSDQKAEQTQHAKTLREKDRKISTLQGKITNLQTCVRELEKENEANKSDKKFQEDLAMESEAYRKAKAGETAYMKLYKELLEKDLKRMATKEGIEKRQRRSETRHCDGGRKKGFGQSCPRIEKNGRAKNLR